MARATFRRTRLITQGSEGAAFYPASGNGNGEFIEEDAIENGDSGDRTKGNEEYKTIGGEKVFRAKLPTGKGKTEEDSGGKRQVKEWKKAPLSQTGNIEKLLLSIHQGIAILTKHNEWAITEPEAKLLGNGIREIQEAYGLPEMSEKTQAAWDMSCALGVVYGARIIATHKRNEAKKEANKVQPISGTPFNAPGPISPVTNAKSVVQ